MLDTTSSNPKEVIKTYIPKEMFLKANGWEQRFIAQVMHQETLSSGQWAKIREIYKKYKIVDVNKNVEELANNIYG